MLVKLYLGLRNLGVYPISEVKDYEGFIILDCFDRIYRGHKKYIPQLFCGKQVFISSQSFQQNHVRLRHEIRSYISRLLPRNIIAIGGESYLYGMLNCENIVHYTNSKYIYDDCDFNNKFYRKKIDNNLIDYNFDKITQKYNFCLVNLSKLPIKLLKQLNDNLYFRLVVISCDQDDFWRKREYLGNYRLKERKKFVCWKIGYFITVNIFIPEFVSLGGNCAVTYHLNRLGLRYVAYPFDWCRIGYNKLLRVLRDNFKDYCELEYVKFSSNHGNSYVVRNRYGHFAHEVFLGGNIIDFQKKLVRRVERFKKLKKCVFVRIELKDVEDYSGLRNELDKHFNYKLVVISGKNFLDWKFNNINWEEIFNGDYAGAT